MECLKQKDIPAPDKMNLTLYETETSATLVDALAGQLKPLNENQHSILDTLMGWPDWEAGRSDLKAACGVPPGSFQRDINDLVRRGKVLHWKTHKKTRSWYAIPEPDRPKSQPENEISDGA